MLKIAHISDLHFFKASFNPLQLASKRLLGNLNQLIFRRLQHDPSICFDVINQLKEEGVSHIILTGDVSTTSFRPEFRRAKSYIENLKEAGFKVFALPGNHDAYTRFAYRNKSFFHALSGAVPFQSDENLPFHLEEDQVSAHKLADNLWLVLIDTALYTSYRLSSGHFTHQIEDRLRKLLARLPKRASIILANHFPFFETVKPQNRLFGGPRLERLLRDTPSIKLYLHGHTHQQSMADLRHEELPVILDSGSLSLREYPSFNLIEIQGEDCSLQTMRREQNIWTSTKELKGICL
ncbi:MAG: metallophosphoesterase [Simkaniaceae bacterium]|nr:metallophosphoesterase [Simkaniaceae bacterium]